LAYPRALTAAELPTNSLPLVTPQMRKFVGALGVTKIDKKIMLNAPWTHDSLCTYFPRR
jgi:hypothetical protein